MGEMLIEVIETYNQCENHIATYITTYLVAYLWNLSIYVRLDVFYITDVVSMLC